MPKTNNPYLAVQNILNEDAKAIIMSRAQQANPHLNGADVADILDTYDQHDGCLYFTEPYWERHAPKEAKLPQLTPFYRVSAIAVALLLDNQEEPTAQTALLTTVLAQCALWTAGVVAR